MESSGGYCRDGGRERGECGGFAIDREGGGVEELEGRSPVCHRDMSKEKKYYGLIRWIRGKA